MILISVSISGVDSKWMQTLRMHHIAKSTSLQHSRPHSPTTVTHFLPYLQNQDSYAAALRRTRTPINYQFTPINHSRNSSPVSYGLTRNLSSLHINSKGSSTSSTASDTPSERDKSAGKNRNSYHGSDSHSSSINGRYSGQTSPVAPKSSGKVNGTSQPTLNPARSYSHKNYTHNPRKSIPGMPLKTESDPKAKEEDSKVSEGGWIKVQHSKKSHRQSTSKTSKERSKGTWRGRRTF